jgi:hypothetical protein
LKATFRIGKRSRFAGDRSLVFFLCNGSSIKGIDVSPLNGAPHAITAGRYHHRGCLWPYKSRVKATSRENGEKHWGAEIRNLENIDKKAVHTAKIKTNTSSKPKKPTLTSPSSRSPPANQKKEEPKQQDVTFIITKTKGKQKGKVIHRREQKSLCCKPPRDLQKQ